MAEPSTIEAVRPASSRAGEPHRKVPILFLTNHSDLDASNRYRIYQFLPYLEEAGFDCTVRPFTSPELFRLLKKPGSYAQKVFWTMRDSARRLGDVLTSRNYALMFIHREAFPFGIPWMERFCRQFNPRMVFSFDDAIYAGHAEEEVRIHPLLYRLKYGPRVNWVIQHSVHVIAGNRILADYAKQLNARVSIVPTVIDTEKFRLRELAPQPKIRIGWVGSPTTSSYLVPLIEVFRELLRRHPQKLEFHFYGDPGFPRFADQVVVREFRLESELEDLQSFGIGIMPLPDNAWARGKCGFKAIQYMAVGVPTVASPVGMVDELIADGKTGLLASSAEDWFSKLNLLIENAGLRRELGTRGRQQVEQNFSLRLWGPRFAQLLREIYACHANDR